MNNTTTLIAWLEKSDGTRISLRGDCPIGRMPENKIVLPEDKVSRHHALIQHREHDEYWLVDLGSSNGTYHNHRRIRAPVLLRHGDHVQVGDHGLFFHQTIGSESVHGTEKTIFEVKSVDTWLLVADIEGSSRLQQTLPLGEARKIIHAWMNKTREIVEKHHGAVNQFLGDGVFAYWRDEEGARIALSNALLDLKILRRTYAPAFRLALHYGSVMLGGSVLGEDNLHGPEVNFVFRMENLAKQLKEFCLISDAAVNKLQGAVQTHPLGAYTLPSFAAETRFHSYPPEVGSVD